jgi:hypothetical protein
MTGLGSLKVIVSSRNVKWGSDCNKITVILSVHKLMRCVDYIYH